MGGVRSEKGVLKLVRPGGIVEFYKNPIAAAEIMQKYPRHCVTRPDFFKFPYIVVKPESILKPGRVFFIVPRYTIRRLLQSKTNVDFSVDFTAIEYGQPLIEPNSNKTLDQNMENLSFDRSFFDQLIIPDANPRKKKHHDQKQKVKPKSQQVAILGDFRFKDGDFYSPDEAAKGCLPLRRKGGGFREGQKGNLKSCLKKHRIDHTIRTQRGPRVTFKLPNKHEDDDDEEFDTECF